MDEHLPSPAPPIPDTPAVVDPAAGEWIKRVVLPEFYKDSYYRALITLCSCQLDMCSGCAFGTVHCKGRGERSGTPTSYLLNSKGLVAIAWAQVWRARGPACRFVCRCDCRTPVPDPQMSLF